MGSASSLGSESRASTFLSDEEEEILGEDILTPMKGPGKVYNFTSRHILSKNGTWKFKF